MAIANEKKLSPQERAMYFSQMTRKYEQRLETLTYAEGQTLNVTLPKARFLSKITLLVQGTFKAKHASKTSFGTSVFDKYNLLKQVRLTTNGAFNPYQLSGGMLRVYNMINEFKNLGLSADTFELDNLQKVASSAGTVNKVQFAVELPVTINDRDTVGLMLLQNDQTVVTISIDCDNLASMLSATDSDVVLDTPNITITPVIETFSVPPIPNAVPDYSIIKMVNQQVENIVSNGEMTIKLPTSLTYRKFFIYLASDTKLTPIDPDNVSSFQLVYNQADTPINVPAEYIEYKNKKAYQGALPKGCYAFDFSEQGIANMGGARDYVDSERLTELWLKVNFKNLTGNSNYVYLVSEKLARLV